ncbi:MAG: porin family protein [Bacteroidales bacterium]|jgi:hypothetical protein|nr:porin family protein [Bacteroidales bacterium]
MKKQIKYSIAFMLVLLFVNIDCVMAQKNHPLKLDKKPAKKEVDAFKATIHRNRRVSFTMAAKYRNVRFINETYENSLSAKYIKPKFGYEITTSLMIHPVEIEITGFSNGFDTYNDSLKHNGFEFLCNLYVLPYLGKVSQYLYPYIGIGYQTSRLATKRSSKEKEAHPDSFSSIGTGNFMFKCGMRVYIARGFFFGGEYKQGFPLSNKTTLFRAWSIGLGMSF